MRLTAETNSSRIQNSRQYQKIFERQLSNSQQTGSFFRRIGVALPARAQVDTFFFFFPFFCPSSSEIAGADNRNRGHVGPDSSGSGLSADLSILDEQQRL